MSGQCIAVSVVRVVVMLLHYKSAARAENNFKMAVREEINV